MDEEYRRWRAEQSRAWLSHIRSLNRSLDSRRDEIEMMRSKMLPQAVSYTGMPTSPNAYGDAIPDAIAAMQELIESYVTELTAYVDEVRYAHRVIDSLSREEYSTVLRGHYLNGKTWEQVALDTGYSYDYTVRLAQYALAELWDMVPHEWRSKLYDARP